VQGCALYASGYPDDIVAQHGVREAGAPLIVKPFAPTELTRKVRDVLDAPPNG